ncbi:MAG: hypothetical protein AAB455_03600 [Patescibacteria group bacterium]
MGPLLVIHFTDRLHQITTDDPTHLFYFDRITGEVAEKIIDRRRDDGLVRVTGFSPGGAIFHSRFVQKYDERENALSFKPGWHLELARPLIKLTFSNGTMSVVNESKVAALKVVFANDSQQTA